MSIASNLQALAENLSSILSAINTKLTAKGSTAADTLSEVAGKINAIPTGGITPTGTKSITENGTYDVTEFASASVAVPEPSGTKTITTNGTHDVAAYASATVNVPTENPPSGTVNITANGTVDVTNYASAEVAVPTGTARSSSDLTASGATVTVPAGLYSSQASKSVSTATQATPSISVNTTTGVITASATQSAGYVSAGTKSATQSLTTRAAQTVTPGTYDQTIPSGVFLTGAQTIKGDAYLIPSNIKKNVNIFGVEGKYEAGDGASVEIYDRNPTGVIEGSRSGGGTMAISGINIPSGRNLIGVYLFKANATESNDRLQSLLVLSKANDVTGAMWNKFSNSYPICPSSYNSPASDYVEFVAQGSYCAITLRNTSITGSFDSGYYKVYPIFAY